MIASLLNDRSYIPQSLTQEDTEKAKNKQEMKLQIISEFDEAKELSKEAGRLQLRASQHQERAREIQKSVKVNIKFTKNDYLIFTNYGKS